MAHGPRFRVPLRRRRQGRTDFRARLALLKSRKTRVVVRKSNNNTIVQFVDYDETGDQVLAAASALELRKFGYKGHTGNTTAAYLAGLLAGTRAKKAGVESGVLDLGLQSPVPGSRIFAGLAGAVEAGIEIPHGESVLPNEDRISGAAKGAEAVQDFEATKAAVLGGGSQ